MGKEKELLTTTTKARKLENTWDVSRGTANKYKILQLILRGNVEGQLQVREEEEEEEEEYLGRFISDIA